MGKMGMGVGIGTVYSTISTGNHILQASVCDFTHPLQLSTHKNMSNK